MYRPTMKLIFLTYRINVHCDKVLLNQIIYYGFDIRDTPFYAEKLNSTYFSATMIDSFGHCLNISIDLIFEQTQVVVVNDKHQVVIFLEV